LGRSTAEEHTIMTMTREEIQAINDRADTFSTRRYEAQRTDSLRPFQAQADSAFNECGLGAAPRRRTGDTEVQHATGVLDELLSHVAALPSLAAQWRGFDPRRLSDKATIDAIAPVVFADAVKAMNATGTGSGPERCIEKRDSAGRTLRHFAGDFDPWRPFKAEARLVTAWNPAQHGRGANATGAIVPVATMMSDGSVR
jgi:hypothetical protein